MPLWGWVLGLGAVGYFLYKGSGTTPAAAGAPPAPPGGGWSTGPVAYPGTYTPGNYPMMPSTPASPAAPSAPAVANPATPSVSDGSVSGPLFSTGYHDVSTGAELVQDALGRTFLYR